MSKKYRIDVGSIVDNETGNIYSEIQVRNLLNKYDEENKQLKSIIKEAVKLLSEEVDVFSDKATEHDLMAYRELQQLDNKDAYDIATATKTVIKMLNGLVK